MADSKKTSRAFSNLDKNLPFSEEGERFILGALLMGQIRTYDDVMEILSEEDFHKQAHKDIFACMVQLYKNGQTADILSLSEALKKEKKLEGVGGDLYLADLVAESASPISAEECAHLIREKSILRQIINLCGHFQQRAMSQDFSKLDAFIDSLERSLFQFTENLTQNQLLPVPELIKGNLERLEELYHKKISVTGVSSSFTELDNLTSGFQPGELSIIAARPSMGKQLSVSMWPSRPHSIIKKWLFFR